MNHAGIMIISIVPIVPQDKKGLPHFFCVRQTRFCWFV